MQPRLRESTAPVRESAGAANGASPAAWQVWARNLAIAALAGVFLALSGAMQTQALPLTTRLLYWAPLMLGGSVIGHGMAMLIRLIPHANVNRWLFGALLALGISLPVTVIVWVYTNTLFATGMPQAALPELFGNVLIISAAMSAIMVATNWPGRVTHAAPDAAAAPVRFLDRLTPKLKGALLYAVSAEDHYLRLHTSSGSDLILMRLIDAIGELDGLEGAQTHRSWWVAREAVEGVRREGDRLVLLLKGGVEAPVSRPNVRQLRESGWF